jgi:hypothetical protein
LACARSDGQLACDGSRAGVGVLVVRGGVSGERESAAAAPRCGVPYTMNGSTASRLSALKMQAFAPRAGPGVSYAIVGTRPMSDWKAADNSLRVGRLYSARAAALAITITVCGCGGSGHAGTRPTAQRPPAQQASRRLAPSPGKLPTVPVATRKGQAPGMATNTMTSRSFQALASTACQAVSSGVPGATRGLGPGQGPRASALAAYEASRRAAIQQTIGTLSRLRPPASLQAAVGRLVGALWRLQQLYVASSQQPGGSGAYSTLRRSIAVAEQEVTDNALAAGLRGCSPTGLGPSIGPGQPTAPGQPVSPGPRGGGRLP